MGSSKCMLITFSFTLMILYAIVLDPHIGYSQFHADYNDDLEIQDHIDESLSKIHKYYLANYTRQSPGPAAVLGESSVDLSVQRGTPAKKDFTAQYKQTVCYSPIQKLEEFLLLPNVNWDSCDPIQ